MQNPPMNLIVVKVTRETDQMRLLSVKPEKAWDFIPGQVAVLGLEGQGESYYAIASAPENKSGMEFLVRDGKGVSTAVFRLDAGATLQAKGPVGKGFPIDKYKGRDFLIAAVGSAISPMRSVIQSMLQRRRDFGKVTLVYGMRHPQGFPFLYEMEQWKKSKIDVILTVSQPEGTNWSGKTGHVQKYFEEALKPMKNPIALISGMKAMIEETRSELTRLGVASENILTNY
jgi:sulfhydrogenase subunit gamma (sulfur reductase)